MTAASSQGINILFFPLLLLPDSLDPFKKPQPSLQKRTYCNVFKFRSKTQEDQSEGRTQWQPGNLWQM